MPVNIAKELKRLASTNIPVGYPNDNDVVISGTVTVKEDWLDEDSMVR